MTKLKLSGKQKFKQRDFTTGKCLIEHHPDVRWYDYGFDEKTDIPNSSQEVDELKNKAELLYEHDVKMFNQLQQSKRGSESAWVSTVISKGTATDKKTALELVVRMSPVHSISHIAALVNIIEKKSTREAYSVLASLKDLFMNDLLPHNRKLIPFSSRPLKKVLELSSGNQKNLEKRLILWKFESDLKALYDRFINGIEKLATGTVEDIGSQACRAALDLLAECPEQEQRLLSFLVNKLGYPNRTLASKVMGYLTDLTYRQPNMRSVIVDEVERLIFRKNIPRRTQLYGVGFLSQIRFRDGEHELAVKLLKIYFSLFRIFVMKNELEDKTLSVLLSAINRAYPFASGHTSEINVEVDLLYKILHQTSFGVAIQALNILSQISSGNEDDRFYNALYRKMLAKCPGITAQSQFFDLLYRVLKKDPNSSRVIAFVKRVLQLSLTKNAEYACGALLMVSRLVSENPDILKLSKASQTASNCASLEQSNIKDEEEEHFVDIPDTSDENRSKENEFKTKVSSVGSWIHAKNIVLRSQGTAYDRSAINPSFARADLSIFSELLFLRDHYHPSVSHFASNILAEIDIKYDGSPLSDLNAMRFLDRFVYRNPKTKKSNDDNAIKKSLRKAYNPKGVKKLPVMSKEYMAMATDEIPVDEQYLHHFVKSLKKEVKDEELDEDEVNEESDSDIESVNSDEFNMYLDRMGLNATDDFDVDYGKEFSTRSSGKQARKKRSKEFSSDDEYNSEKEGSDLSNDDDSDAEEMSSEELSNDEEDSNEDSDGTDQYSGLEDSEDELNSLSDNDFAEKSDDSEDAVESADELDEIMEERDKKLKLKSKNKFKKRQKRKIR